VTSDGREVRTPRHDVKSASGGFANTLMLSCIGRTPGSISLCVQGVPAQVAIKYRINVEGSSP
jgi:hypothetical protein